VSVPVIFLDYLSYHAHRGKESFDTHVWMLETLLGRSAGWRSAESQIHPKDFLLYVIAASFEKMNIRITNKRVSTTYSECLKSQTTFTFIKLSSEVSDRQRDRLFVETINPLAKFATTKIPNLQLAANQWSQHQDIEIYNGSTYMEFHQLLCEFLSRFADSLKDLQDLQKAIKIASDKSVGMVKILDALKKVRSLGHFLRTMVRTSALETHLQTIAHLLVVDTRKSWTPEPDSEDSDDSDDVDFQRLKPYSMRKGKALLPWESYRDWLRLMVHYFDAAGALTAHVATWDRAHDALSITILSPPLPDKQMLPWTELLENDRFFPTLPGESSGKDFVKFLTNSYNTDDLPIMNVDIQQITTLVQGLKKPESGELAPLDGLKIDELAQLMEEKYTADPHVAIEKILEKILALKGAQPQNQPAVLQIILEMLNNLSKRASFYTNLKQGPLRSGRGFSGKHHCEAYIASLLTLLVHSGESVSDSEERLNILSGHWQKMEVLLVKIKASHVFMHCLNLC
jgi:hypothetical protein